MNLDELKEKIGDESHKALSDYVTDLVGQRDAARRESIDGRKSLKLRAETLEAINRKVFDKLGIDSEEELDQLPDAKGQAEALKQFEVQMKRLTREREDAVKARDELAASREKDRRQAALSAAVAKHGFVDPEMASLALERGMRIEGDAILFEADGGKLVPLDEGAAWLAKAKPYMVRSSGSTGSGYRDTAAGSSSTPAKAPQRKDYTDEVQFFKDAAKFAAQASAS
jgi:hypothetical protein